jgi:hypothetical protein
MKRHAIVCTIVLTLLTALPVRADDAPGVEPLARGPLHEAYAEPVSTQPEAPPPLPKEPPPLLPEQPPDQKPEGDNVEWIPGYWQWDADRNDFIWVSGLWRTPPPGRRWVPGHYQQVGDSWQWVAGFWGAESADLTLLPNPPTEPDVPAPAAAPSDDSFYVPGCWVYRDLRYLWRPGYWLAVRPNWIWQPAHYVWTPAGCLFVDGYWDYPLGQRGLLFAPAAIDLTVALRPGWCFTPSYCVPPDFLPTALFVRPRWGHYYFGDYFGPTCVRAGFTPWVDCRIGCYAYDPLFAHYRLTAPTRTWERDVRAVYAGRAAGQVPLPPRSFAAQERVVHDLRAQRVDAATIHRVAPLAPLSAVGRRTPLTLTPLHAAERDRIQRQTAVVHNFAAERRTHEAAVLREQHSPLRSGEAPRALHLTPPRGAAATPPRRTEVRSESHPGVRTAVAPPQGARHAEAPHAPPHVAAPTAHAPAHGAPPAVHRPAPSALRAAPHYSAYGHTAARSAPRSSAAHAAPRPAPKSAPHPAPRPAPKPANHH